jgi:hypothetical protein
MEKYVNKTNDLKDKLLALDEAVLNNSLYQLIFNNLSKNYEGIVQTLSNLYTIFNFD